MFTWEAVLAVEGSPTGDGRLFEVGAITWRELPLTLLYMPATDDGHDGSFAVGRILEIERVSTGKDAADLVARGDWVATDDPSVLTAIDTIQQGVVRGVSVDVGLDLFMIAPFDEGVALVTEDGEPIEEDPSGPEIDEAIMDEDGDGEPWLQIENVVTLRVQKATIMAATVVATPAFAEGLIEALDSPALVAGAALEAPPAAWFDDPRLEGPTPLTITAEGRVFGHLAAWGQCHIGMPGCFTPPTSATDYAMFLLGERETSDGAVAVGQITLATNHADLSMTGPKAREHYEHTGAAVADVSAGEDPHGIWVAGALRPGLTEAQVIELRGAKLSGDWRAFAGSLEMVGALAVNVPGFPVPRGAYAGASQGDRALALVSAGALGAAIQVSRLAGRITRVRKSATAALTPPAEHQGDGALAALGARVYGADLARLADRAAEPELQRIAARI